jgi:hypothetical protein
MLLMFKRVLKQKWLVTIGKTAIVGLLYFVSLLGLMILTIVMSVVFI